MGKFIGWLSIETQIDWNFNRLNSGHPDFMTININKKTIYQMAVQINFTENWVNPKQLKNRYPASL